MNRSVVLLLLAAFLLAGALVAADDARPPDRASAGSDEPGRVHTDSGELVEAAADAVRAYLVEDPRSMRAALDRVERSTRRLDPERDEALGADLINYEQAFHETLDRAREYSGRGRLDDAFNQFVWTQRACLVCHGIARERGLLDPGPLTPASRP